MVVGGESELLEREPFLAAVHDALSASAQGEGQLLLVAGEAGVGKTALVRAFARDSGTRVLEGACDALFTPRPLAPIADVAARVGGPLEELVARGARAYAVLAVLLVFGLKLSIPALSRTDFPFTLFLAAVLFGSWFGGIGPGLVATVLAALIGDYYFLPPIGNVFVGGEHEPLRLLQFVIEGCFISVLSGMRHHYLHLLHRRVEELLPDRWKRLRLDADRR